MNPLAEEQRALRNALQRRDAAERRLAGEYRSLRGALQRQLSSPLTLGALFAAGWWAAPGGDRRTGDARGRLLSALNRAWILVASAERFSALLKRGVAATRSAADDNA